MRWTTFAGLLFAGTAAFLLALLSPVSNIVHADDAKDTDAEDFQDLVFLGDHGPVILRLHILIDGKPFATVWDDAIRSLFNYLDRNGDGVLSKEEAERAPKVQRLLQQVRVGNFFVASGGTATMADLDTDPEDGKVTLDEFRKYYRQYDFAPIELTVAPVQDFASSALTDVLFTELDRNKDGKLSKEELAHAPAALQVLDIDDDELISIQELAPGAGAQPQVQLNRPGSGATAADNTALALINRADGANRLAVAQQMLRRYDRDNNQKLSQSEIHLDKSTFDRLDTNKDGELEIVELMRLLRRPPDCEMIVRLGKWDGKGPRAAVYNVEGRPRALNFEVRPVGDTALLLNAGGAQIKLACNLQSTPDYDNLRRFYVREFNDADVTQKGYLLLKDLTPQRFQTFRALFAAADRNGDGKLTVKELNVYIDLQAQLAAGYTSLGVTDQGRGLFEALDANHDGRLS